MANIGTGGDLLSNFSLSGGIIGCHSSWDLCTTVTGDLALTKDDIENSRQRLLMWIALPRGERLDNKLGCCVHEYFHQKNVRNVRRKLELDVTSDLNDVFPDLSIRNIAVKSINDLSGGNREVVIALTLGPDNLQFVANWNEIMNITEEMSEIIYYGGSREDL